MSEPDPSADAKQALDPLQELHEITRAFRRRLAWHKRAGSYAAPGGPMARPADLDLDTGDVAPAVHEHTPAQAAYVEAAPHAHEPPGLKPSEALALALAESRDADPGRPVQADRAAPSTRLALADVRAELGDCQRCKLCQTRTHIVFGEGDAHAALMFVGEAPGEDEDRSGRPFVGRAGKLLDAMITAMGWMRQSVYIANVLKCRPPHNRDPESDEIDACRPFLAKQIECISPRVIVALGRPAAHLLLDTNAPMHALRGRFYSYRDIKVMPTYHPAYLLRGKDARETRERKGKAWDDLKQVIAELSRAGVRTPFPPKT